MGESAYLHIMKRAAEKASPYIVRDFGELERLQNSRNSLINFVDLSYKKAEERIAKELVTARPDFSVAYERTDMQDPMLDSSTYTWLVGPISGVTNFARSIPYFATNIALIKGRELVAGMTFDNLRGECFKAEQGCGAFIGNRNRLRVSCYDSIQGAIIALHTAPEINTTLIKNGAKTRMTGALALDLAYLAAGKYDCVIAHNVRFLDIASGMILVREAGGLLSYSQKNEGYYDIIAASSAGLLKLAGNVCASA